MLLAFWPTCVNSDATLSDREMRQIAGFDLGETKALASLEMLGLRKRNAERLSLSEAQGDIRALETRMQVGYLRSLLRPRCRFGRKKHASVATQHLNFLIRE